MFACPLLGYVSVGAGRQGKGEACFVQQIEGVGVGVWVGVFVYVVVCMYVYAYTFIGPNLCFRQSIFLFPERYHTTRRYSLIRLTEWMVNKIIVGADLVDLFG